MKRYLTKQSAFSFLEVLAALVILSVALTPILIWVPTSIETKIRAQRNSSAIFLAQYKIEELRFRIINDFSYEDSGGSFGGSYADFRYSTTYNLENSNLKTISVTVWHIERPGDETRFYTQIARR